MVKNVGRIGESGKKRGGGGGGGKRVIAKQVLTVSSTLLELSLFNPSRGFKGLNWPKRFRVFPTIFARGFSTRISNPRRSFHGFRPRGQNYLRAGNNREGGGGRGGTGESNAKLRWQMKGDLSSRGRGRLFLFAARKIPLFVSRISILGTSSSLDASPSIRFSLSFEIWNSRAKIIVDGNYLDSINISAWNIKLEIN